MTDKKSLDTADFQLSHNRKSQMEIMGLIVIILLLSIGMLFTVHYMINKEPSNAKDEFTKSQMASNILSSILKTSTPQDESDPLYCHKVDFTELLQDCFTFRTIECDNGQLSCDYAHEQITNMLDATLKKWKRPYRFKVWRVGSDVDPDRFETIVNLGCDDDNIGPGKDYSGREPALNPVPLNPGTLMVQFDICS